MDKSLEVKMTDEYGKQAYCECGGAIVFTAWDGGDSGWRFGKPYCLDCTKTWAVIASEKQEVSR